MISISFIINKLTNPLYRNTLIYTVTDAISKGLAFFVLPFISYYLDPDQLGIAANFDVLVSILSLVAGLAIVNGLPYFYYDRTKEDVAVLIFNLILIFSTILITSVGIFFLSSDLIDTNLHLGLSLQLLTILNVLCVLLTGLGTTVYRLENKPIPFSVLQILQTLINLSLLIWLVIGQKQQAVGKIYSMVGTNIVMSIIHTTLLFKRGFIKVKLKSNSIKELLRFGLPLLPHSLSFWLKGGMDKVLLTTYCGLAANGLYSMALSFGAMYSIFATAFSNAYVPYLQERLSKINDSNRISEHRSIVVWSYKVMMIFGLLYGFVLVTCWFAIKYVLSDKYIGSLQFLPWLLLAQFLQACYSMVVQFPYSQKKTFGLGAITFSSSVIQLFLTYLFVSTMGITGINVSLVLGTLITLVGVWWYSNRVYPLPWFNIKF